MLPLNERGPILFIVMLLSILFAYVACTTEQAKQVASVTSAIAQTVCDVATAQPEPAWVAVTCTAVDAGGKVVQSFPARVPRANVTAASCPPPKRDGTVAP